MSASTTIGGGTLRRVALAVCLSLPSLVPLDRVHGVVRAADSSTWSLQKPLPRAYSPSAIACPSITACVAVGGGGSIVNSEDGGKHWTNRTSGTQADLESVVCPELAVCYALGFPNAGSPGRPPPPRQHPVLLTSMNGGESWKARTLKLLAAPGSSLACASPTTCLASIYPTGLPTAPLRTTNGGKSWLTVKVPVPEGIGGIRCATTTICYGINSLTGAVARSGDGGKTWQQRTRVPKPGIEILQAIACPRANTCVVTSSYCCDEGQRGSIFLSRDGARTWRRVDRLASHAIYGITCPRATTCYVSRHRFVLVTTDSGQTWAKRRVPNPVSDIAWSDTIACPRPVTCYAVAGFTVLKTVDGFLHVEETLPHSAIRSLDLSPDSCPTTTACYAAGAIELRASDASARGPVATSDGGTRRKRELMAGGEPAPPMTSIACPAIDRCYAAGGLGGVMILATRPGASDE